MSADRTVGKARRKPFKSDGLSWKSRSSVRSSDKLDTHTDIALFEGSRLFRSRDVRDSHEACTSGVFARGRVPLAETKHVVDSEVPVVFPEFEGFPSRGDESEELRPSLEIVGLGLESGIIRTAHVPYGTPPRWPLGPESSSG